MFNHLKDTDGACLGKEDYLHFCKYVRKKKQDKVLILFGYLPTPSLIGNGSDAARLLINAIQEWENQLGKIASDSNECMEQLKFSRSYGSEKRCVDIVSQDEDTGAITELVSVRLQPLRKDSTCDQFLDGVQDILDKKLAYLSPVPIRILGRQGMSQAKFNAEMDVTHRRIEYLLPIDFLSWSCTAFKTKVEALPSFSENHKHNMIRQEESEFVKPDVEVRTYLHKLKKYMQMLSTQIIQLDMSDKSAVLEKEFSLQKRKTQSKKSNRRKRKNKGEADDSNSDFLKGATSHSLVKNEGQKILKRKRFHNFTKTVMGASQFSQQSSLYRLLTISRTCRTDHIKHMNIWRIDVWTDCITGRA